MIFKWKQIIRIARMLYRNWITNPRMLLVFVLCVFAKTIVADPLVTQAIEVGSPLNILEPFIAIGNSNLLMLFLPFVFLILMSDYPSIGDNTLFLMIRTGKTPWFWGQVLFLWLGSLTYLLVILCFSCCSVIGTAAFTESWSDAITKYMAMFPEKFNVFTAQFIPSNLYNQLPIGEALFHTFFLLLFYFILIGMILMLFRFLRMHTAGLLVNVGLIGIGSALYATKWSAMWAFPMSNSLISQHFQNIAAKPVYPLWASYLYFLALIVLCCIGNYTLIKKMNLIGMI